VEIDRITDRIIGSALMVHKDLGPGLLESAYQACMAYELMQRGIGFERQKSVPVLYRGIRMDCGYRIDFLVERNIILELKSLDRLDPIHSAQLLTYMKLACCPVGLLMNFNVHLLKDGVKRFVLGYAESTPQQKFTAKDAEDAEHDISSPRSTRRTQSGNQFTAEYAEDAE
jgi:GxxExxY protein